MTTHRLFNSLNFLTIRDGRAGRRFFPIGPIIVTLKYPETFGDAGIEYRFCKWECLAAWACVQSRRVRSERSRAQLAAIAEQHSNGFMSAKRRPRAR
jgi:hypothetical protein